MTYRLRHNTPVESALAIIKDRCVSATVEPYREYGYGNGPYFFVEGMALDEVASGGNHHPANLYFDCELEPECVLSSDLNAALGSEDTRAVYEGKLLLCYRNRGLDGKLTEFREAIIIPMLGKAKILPDCLKLVQFEPVGLFDDVSFITRRKRKEAAETMIADGTPFSVGIRYAH